MKFFYLLLMFVFTSQLNGQVCTPNPDLPLTSPALFPLPFGIFTPEEGGTGIDKNAVIGEFFEYEWSFILPEDYVDAESGSPVAPDSTIVKKDSISYIFNEERIYGLPNGLTFETYPENGIFFPSSTEPSGCFRLSGTPAEDVAPGEYSIIFRASNCVVVGGVAPLCLSVDIPSVLSRIPGIYELTIDVRSATNELIKEDIGLTLNPNPSTTESIVSFNSDNLSGEYLYALFDLQGKKVFSESRLIHGGIQSVSINTEFLNNGLYIFQLSGNEGILSTKLLVHH